MDDPLLVRIFERLRNLQGNRARILVRHRAASGSLGQIVAVDALHYERDGMLDRAVDLCDMGMVQQREHVRFALESGDAFRIDGKKLGQQLDGDVTPQLRIARAIDLAHAAGPERASHFVGADPAADRDGHCRGW